MKRVCAWCGRELDPPAHRENVLVTHGLCQACRRRFFTSSKALEADSRSALENAGADSGKMPTDG
jgi:hypothetical protein